MDGQDRAEGAMVGLALGDSLGFPLEGLSPRRIRRRHPQGRIDSSALLAGRGFVSDDTEQAVMVAESLLESSAHPERAFSRRLVAWFWSLPPGIGLATLRSCLKNTVGIRRGVRSAGNGAAMRAAPLGLWRAERSLVDAISRITHTDPRALDGAWCVARSVQALVEGEWPDWPWLNLRLGPLDERLRSSLEAAWSGVESNTSFEQLGLRIGTTGYVLHTVPLALACLWSRPDSFESGLTRVLLLGGDVDSTGAVAGALLGAHFGCSNPPERWRLALEPAYSQARLRALGRSLWRRSLDPEAVALRPGFMARRWREFLVKLGVALHIPPRMVGW